MTLLVILNSEEIVSTPTKIEIIKMMLPRIEEIGQLDQILTNGIFMCFKRYGFLTKSVIVRFYTRKLKEMGYSNSEMKPEKKFLAKSFDDPLIETNNNAEWVYPLSVVSN